MFNFKELASKLSTIKPVSIKATYFRFIGLQYLQSPLSAICSKMHGGRYNFKNSFETLCCAPNPESATKESVRGFSLKFSPKVLISIDITVSRVIDLGDSSVLKTLEIDPKKLLVAWRKAQNINNEEAYTQKLGRVIFASEQFEAIRYPSAMVKNCYNLAVFPERLLKTSRLKIFDPSGIIEQVLQGKTVSPEIRKGLGIKPIPKSKFEKYQDAAKETIKEIAKKVNKKVK